MDLDAIWKRARTDLSITTDHGEPDWFLWEHARRVVNTARWLAGLDEIRARQPDEVAVVAAALYYDVGWAIRVREGEIDRTEVLLGAPSSTAADQASLLLEERLSDILSTATLQRAAVAVRTVGQRVRDSVDAQIVAEANHLDEFGLSSLWPAIRRGMLDGKGVQAIVDTWRRKREYHFWEARLQDSFQFSQVRSLARNRLKTLEQFMQLLADEHAGSDVASLAGVSVDEALPRQPT